jgi:uncharacterized membrane protein (UPF0127 family)
VRVVQAVDDASDRVVAEHVEVATSMWARFWGLMFRRKLDEGHALLIDPCSSVHTFFMRFRMDAVFLDKDGVVTKVAACMKPYRAALGPKSKKVLEMPCGAAEAAGISAGSKLSFR